MTIHLEDVFLLVTPVDDFAHTNAHDIEEAQRRRQRFYKQQKLEAAEMLRKEKLETMRLGSLREKKRQDSMSYVDKLLQTVLDNVQITIRNLHIRFEAGSKDKGMAVSTAMGAASPSTQHGGAASDDGYAFGVTMQELYIRSCDANQKAVFIDASTGGPNSSPSIFLHRSIALERLSVYWESRPKFFSDMPAEKRAQAFAFWITASTALPTTGLSASAVPPATPVAIVAATSAAGAPVTPPLPRTQPLALSASSRVFLGAPQAPTSSVGTSPDCPSAEHFLLLPVSATIFYVHYRLLDAGSPKHEFHLALSTIQLAVDALQISGMIRFARWLSLAEQWFVTLNVCDYGVCVCVCVCVCMCVYVFVVDCACSHRLYIARQKTNDGCFCMFRLKWDVFRPHQRPLGALPAPVAPAAEVSVAQPVLYAPGTPATAVGSASSSSAGNVLVSPKSGAKQWWQYAFHCLRVAMRERVRPDRWRSLLTRVRNRGVYIGLFKRLQGSVKVRTIDLSTIANRLDHQSPITDRMCVGMFLLVWQSTKAYPPLSVAEQGTLSTLEDELTFEDIVYFRSVSYEELRLEELAVQSSSSSSSDSLWSMFSTSTPSPAAASPTDATAVAASVSASGSPSLDARELLFDSIDYFDANRQVRPNARGS